MFDFKLTPKGDIILTRNESLSRFTLSFSISKFKGQRVSFFTNAQDVKRKRHQQSVSFYFQKKPERNMSEQDITGSQEKMQAARIELKTEQRNTYNYEVGSTFYTLNHTIYKDKNSLAALQNKIETIMNKYFPNCTVVLEFKDGDGYFWCQTLFASVYDSNDKLIDSFEV